MNNNVHFMIRINNNLRDRINKMAVRNNMTASQLARIAITNYVKYLEMNFRGAPVTSEEEMAELKRILDTPWVNKNE